VLHSGAQKALEQLDKHVLVSSSDDMASRQKRKVLSGGVCK
jgi:hypothetical protein